MTGVIQTYLYDSYCNSIWEINYTHIQRIFSLQSNKKTKKEIKSMNMPHILHGAVQPTWKHSYLFLLFFHLYLLFIFDLLYLIVRHFLILGSSIYFSLNFCYIIIFNLKILWRLRLNLIKSYNTKVNESKVIPLSLSPTFCYHPTLAHSLTRTPPLH